MKAQSRFAAALLGALIAAGCVAGAHGAAPEAGGIWAGSYTLPRTAAAVPISVDFGHNRATVAIDYGHAQSQDVRLTARNGRVAFSLPGRPRPVAFLGTVTRSAIAGVVSQGRLRGRFHLYRGGGVVPRTVGLFADNLTVVHFASEQPLLVDVQSGDIHGLRSSGTGFTVGTRIGDESGAGTLRADHKGLVWAGAHARLPVRQFEVRFPSGGATLAGTLTIPPATGRVAAAAFVAGSNGNHINPRCND